MQKSNRGSQNAPILYGFANLVKLWKSLCNSCHLMEQLAQYCFVCRRILNLCKFAQGLREFFCYDLKR